jgi:sec-independent protein translocase protein TatB
MFDIAPSELLLVGLVALIVIGPKDLPKAMRVAGYWVGRARGVARQFRSGFDAMVREAELAELQKQWAAENERIMREHPAPALASPETETRALDHGDVVQPYEPVPHEPVAHEDAPPVMVERPVLKPEGETPPPHGGTPS